MLYLNRSDAKKWNRAQKGQYKVNAELQAASAQDLSKLLKNAGVSPDEAYREMDERTQIILNPVGEFATYQRVNSKSKSVNLGKLDYTYRQASAQTGGKVSLSGQTGIITDAVEYKNAGTVIPIIDHGSKRDWREYLTFGADGFDTMVDDSREGTLVALRTANGYLWNGDATIKSPDDRVWLGLKADPSLVQATTSVDMADNATTAKAIVDEVVRLRDLLRITNNCSQLIELGISREMMSYWESTPYSVSDTGFGTVLSYVRGLNGIASVYEDPQLNGGKELLMAYIDLDGLHAVTGQAMSSYMDQRVKHNDPYVMVKWMAQGFVSKNTFTGQKCALYCKSA
jgi:hypothetical protein